MTTTRNPLRPFFAYTVVAYHSGDNCHGVAQFTNLGRAMQDALYSAKLEGPMWEYHVVDSDLGIVAIVNCDGVVTTPSGIAF